MSTKLLIAAAASLSLVAISTVSATPRHHNHHHTYSSAAGHYVIPRYVDAAAYQRAAERSVAAGNWSCVMGPDLLCHTVDGGTIQTTPEGNARLP
jgi:hypothetical protein